MAAAQEPYKDGRKQPLRYDGPGRDEPEPKDLTEVRIGYFGPNDPKHGLGGTFWTGAARALEEVNRDGGYKGLPFRLVQSWSDNPWRAGASAIVRMVYTDKVWAVIAGIDGVTAHLAEQVVAKALVTLIDPGSSDKTVNMASVPWAFSLLPADPAHANLIGGALLSSPARGSFVLISATDHDSRALAEELTLYLRRNQVTPRRHIQVEPGAQEAATLAAQVAELTPRAVIALAGPADSARIVREFRRVDASLAILGGPAMARQSFLEAAGSSAEGVRFSMPGMEREGLPDYAAVSGYDAVILAATAIRKAGLNRARFRDAIAELGKWDAMNRSTAVPRWATIRNGRRT